MSFLHALAPLMAVLAVVVSFLAEPVRADDLAEAEPIDPTVWAAVKVPAAEDEE